MMTAVLLDDDLQRTIFLFVFNRLETDKRPYYALQLQQMKSWKILFFLSVRSTLGTSFLGESLAVV